MQLNIK